MKHWTDALAKFTPCEDALKWLRTQPNAKAAWRDCKRGDWMLWLLGRLDKSKPWSEERKPLVRIAVACAEEAAQYCTEEMLLAAIWCLDATRRWCDGEAEQDEVDAADAAAYAATATSYASYAASAAAYAASDADAAAYAASYAASYAYAASDAYADRAQSLASSADIVREFHPKAPRLGETK